MACRHCDTAALEPPVVVRTVDVIPCLLFQKMRIGRVEGAIQFSIHAVAATIGWGFSFAAVADALEQRGAVGIWHPHVTEEEQKRCNRTSPVH